MKENTSIFAGEWKQAIDQPEHFALVRCLVLDVVYEVVRVAYVNSMLSKFVHQVYFLNEQSFVEKENVMSEVPVGVKDDIVDNELFAVLLSEDAKPRIMARDRANALAKAIIESEPLSVLAGNAHITRTLFGCATNIALTEKEVNDIKQA